MLGDQPRDEGDLALDAPALELGLADDVQQVVDAPGGDADRVTAARAAGLVVGVEVLDGHGCGAGHLDGVLPGERLVERLHQRLDVLVPDRAVGTGHGVRDGVGDREEEVHQVASDAEATVLQGTQQVLGAVGETHDTVEGERPR